MFALPLAAQYKSVNPSASDAPAFVAENPTVGTGGSCYDILATQGSAGLHSTGRICASNPSGTFASAVVQIKLPINDTTWFPAIAVQGGVLGVGVGGPGTLGLPSGSIYSNGRVAAVAGVVSNFITGTTGSPVSAPGSHPINITDGFGNILGYGDINGGAGTGVWYASNASGGNFAAIDGNLGVTTSIAYRMSTSGVSNVIVDSLGNHYGNTLTLCRSWPATACDAAPPPYPLLIEYNTQARVILDDGGFFGNGAVRTLNSTGTADLTAIGAGGLITSGNTAVDLNGGHFSKSITSCRDWPGCAGVTPAASGLYYSYLGQIRVSINDTGILGGGRIVTFDQTGVTAENSFNPVTGVFSSVGFNANGNQGVNCSGTPSSSFATVFGIVTHC